MRQQIDDLKKHHQFKDWCGQTSLKENHFIWRYFLRGNELPGWQNEYNQTIELPEQVRLIQSIWQRPGTDREQTSLRVDTYECASRVEAHEFLIQLLGQFQIPVMERQKEAAVGDVAFANPQETSLVFARANVVIRISNAGRESIPVKQTIHSLDADLANKPVELMPAKALARFKATRFEIPRRKLRIGQSVALRLKPAEMPQARITAETMTAASGRVEPPPCYKFFASSGDFFLKADEPYYRPESTGIQKLTAFANYADAGVMRQDIKIKVE